jgi:hypothetical protein
VIVRLTQFWHRVRRAVSPTEWLIRLLGLAREVDDEGRSELIIRGLLSPRAQGQRRPAGRLRVITFPDVIRTDWCYSVFSRT